MAQMRKAAFTICVPYLFTYISSLSTESKSYIIAWHFHVHETLQMNQSNFLIFNSTSVQGL